jgi:hypothetical protein
MIVVYIFGSTGRWYLVVTPLRILARKQAPGCFGTGIITVRLPEILEIKSSFQSATCCCRTGPYIVIDTFTSVAVGFLITFDLLLTLNITIYDLLLIIENSVLVVVVVVVHQQHWHLE